jgi:hypothetical protein
MIWLQHGSNSIMAVARVAHHHQSVSAMLLSPLPTSSGRWRATFYFQPFFFLQQLLLVVVEETWVRFQFLHQIENRRVK